MNKPKGKKPETKAKKPKGKAKTGRTITVEEQNSMSGEDINRTIDLILQGMDLDDIDETPDSEPEKKAKTPTQDSEKKEKKPKAKKSAEAKAKKPKADSEKKPEAKAKDKPKDAGEKPGIMRMKDLPKEKADKIRLDARVYRWIRAANKDYPPSKIPKDAEKNAAYAKEQLKKLNIAWEGALKKKSA